MKGRTLVLAVIFLVVNALFVVTKFYNTILPVVVTDEEDALTLSLVAQNMVHNKTNYTAMKSTDRIRYENHEAADGIQGLPFSGNETGNDAIPSYSLDCSCWNSTAILSCCKRSVYRWHKMGSALTATILKPINRKKKPRVVKETQGSKLPKNEHIVERYSKKQRTKQERTVVVIRNLVDSIISGYLYHKSGRECWTDLRGKVRDPDFKYSLLKVDWEKFLILPHAPGRGRNLCAYLNDEPEVEGLRMYADFAMNKWYPGLLEFFETVKANGYDDAEQGPVLFLCYEDLSNPSKQVGQAKKMIDWLYPGGHSYQLPNEPDGEYTGNHATSHDEDLRSRLRRIVESFDSELYNNTIAKTDNATLCGTL